MNVPDLNTWDWIVINSSAGKDSHAMLTHIAEMVKRTDPQDRVAERVVVVLPGGGWAAARKNRFHTSFAWLAFFPF